MSNDQLQLEAEYKGVSLALDSHNIYRLSIQAGLRLNEPIVLHFPQSSYSLRLNINVGEGAQATILERFEGFDEQVIDYTVSVSAKQHSQLKVITYQNLSKNSIYKEERFTDVESRGNVHFLNFQLGSKSVNGLIHQNASGEAAELNVDLLCRSNNTQNHSFDVKNAYDARNGLGKIFVKGIALDESQLKLNGTIQITRQGRGTDAYLKQDSLLLSDKARINAIPGLKIDTNEVKASHGASIVNLNDESLFYLTSRGISQEEARNMMIQGFVTDQLNKISEFPKLKQTIQQLI